MVITDEWVPTFAYKQKSFTVSVKETGRERTVDLGTHGGEFIREMKTTQKSSKELRKS